MGYKVVPGLYNPTEKDKALYEGFSVCVLTPCSDYKSFSRFYKSVANMISYSWMHGLRIYQTGITERMVVDWARNDLSREVKDKINEFTGDKFTHLLWLDDDHVFNPDLAVALARHDKDMVGALYYARVGKPYPVVYVHSGDKKEPYKHHPLIGVPNSLIKCDAIGFGALLMRRDVLDRVPQPWFTIDAKGGEDIVFCKHARDRGIGIYCDGQYKLGHIGTPYIVSEQDYERFLKSDDPDLKDKVKVYLGE